MFGHWPVGRRFVVSALLAFCGAILVVTLLSGLSNIYLVRLMQVAACVLAAIVVLAAVISLVTSRLADYTEPEDDEDEFMALDPRNPRDFEQLVREALDDLPDLLLKALDHVAVVISDQGRRHRAYGLYHGDGVSRDTVPDRIVIFRDTLLRDFGHDPDELRAQVTRTVRHELAHHLGADELGVRELGL